MAFGTRVERNNGSAGISIRPMGSALPHVFESFRQMRSARLLGGDLPVISARLEKVAHIDLHDLANMLRGITA
jgi:hypothetical protein